MATSRNPSLQPECVILGRQFRGTGLHVRKPVPVSMRRHRTQFTAAAPKLGLILEVNGDTITTALRGMAAGISEQYWLLRKIPRAMRSAFN